MESPIRKGCDGRVQHCLSHFIREIKFLTTLPGTATANYGERLLQKMRKLFHVIHQHDTLSAAPFNEALDQACDAVLQEARHDLPEAKPERIMAKRLRKYGAASIEFITTPGIELTNNLVEQAIRFVTIDLHIIQGTRSRTGCQ